MSQLNSVQSSPGKSHSIDPNSTLEAILEKLSKDQKDTFIPIQHIATGGTRHVYVIQKEQEDGTNQAEDGTNQKFILKYDRFGKDIANNKADELLSKGNDTQHEGCVYFNMDPSPFVTFIKRNGTIQVAKKEIHYHVEEFVEGKTLEDFLTSIPKPLKQHEIALFFEDILRGVAHIHDAGFFHRDISPKNVMIVKKKGKYRAKIIDLANATKKKDTIPKENPTTGARVISDPLLFNFSTGKDGQYSALADLYSVGACLAYTLGKQDEIARKAKPKLVNVMQKTLLGKPDRDTRNFPFYVDYDTQDVTDGHNPKFTGKQPTSLMSNGKLDTEAFDRNLEEFLARIPKVSYHELKNIVRKLCSSDPKKRYTSIDDVLGDIKRSAKKPLHASHGILLNVAKTVFIPSLITLSYHLANHLGSLDGRVLDEPSSALLSDIHASRQVDERGNVTNDMITFNSIRIGRQNDRIFVDYRLGSQGELPEATVLIRSYIHGLPPQTETVSHHNDILKLSLTSDVLIPSLFSLPRSITLHDAGSLPEGIYDYTIEVWDTNEQYPILLNRATQSFRNGDSSTSIAYERQASTFDRYSVLKFRNMIPRISITQRDSEAFNENILNELQVYMVTDKGVIPLHQIPDDNVRIRAYNDFIHEGKTIPDISSPDYHTDNLNDFISGGDIRFTLFEDEPKEYYPLHLRVMRNNELVYETVRDETFVSNNTYRAPQTAWDFELKDMLITISNIRTLNKTNPFRGSNVSVTRSTQDIPSNALFYTTTLPLYERNN